MAIALEQRIIYLTDADGNKKFAEVRVYEQFTTLEAVLPQDDNGVFAKLEFDFDGLNDSNQEQWSTTIDGVTFSGIFTGVAEVKNSGLFTEVVRKPKTNRQDTSS